MGLTRAQSAVALLLDRFLNRQGLVAELLREVRSDLLGVGPRPGKEYIRETHRGSWNEWSYRIHGTGCQMIHKHSNEPIDWVPPDLMRFDPNWFADWMEWWFQEGTGDDSARKVIRDALHQSGTDLKSLISETLAAMVAEGLLREFPGRTNRYERLQTPYGDSCCEPPGRDLE